MAHSEDLRKRVLAFVKAGGSKTEAAKRFTVARSVIYDWLGLNELKAAKTGPKGHTKLDSEKLRLLVEEKPDAFLDEYAKLLGVSSFTVHYGLKKMNISRKKNHALCRTK
jgi:transposase